MNIPKTIILKNNGKIVKTLQKIYCSSSINDLLFISQREPTIFCERI